MNQKKAKELRKFAKDIAEGNNFEKVNYIKRFVSNKHRELKEIIILDENCERAIYHTLKESYKENSR